MITNHEQLIKNLEYLKLKESILKIDEVIDFVTSNELTFTEGMIKLTNYEIEAKERSSMNAMVKVGAFPHNKTIKDFDFNFQDSINKSEILQFQNLAFIHELQNIVFMGNSGVGKTHLATAISICAAKKRISTYFIKSHDLINNLRKARLENRLEDRIKHYSKYKLLIVDELGYLPIDKEDSKLFFQLIDKRYENKSTIITTNIDFSSWDDIFKDPVIASAILDRILHHAHVVKITGKSYRIKDYYKEES